MFTHTFEVEATDTGKVEGEISFNGPNNQPPKIKITSPLQMEVQEYRGLGVLLTSFIDFYKAAGEITKIEVVMKP
jgi:hypothetical protein